MPLKRLADNKSGPLPSAKCSPSEVPKWALTPAWFVDGVDSTLPMADMRQEGMVGSPGYQPFNLYRSPFKHFQYCSRVGTAHQRIHIIGHGRQSRKGLYIPTWLRTVHTCNCSRIMWHVHCDSGRSALPCRLAARSCHRSAGPPAPSHVRVLSRIEPANLKTRNSLHSPPRPHPRVHRPRSQRGRHPHCSQGPCCPPETTDQ